MITQQRLKELVIYSPDTGKFFWTNKPELVEAGWISNGYHVIRLDGKVYKAHHLAWLYFYGELPAMLDHEDWDKLNNAITNLRRADFNLNNFNRPPHKNNKLGHRNIQQRPSGKFQVAGKWRGEYKYVGLFANLEDAIRAANQYRAEIENKAKLEVAHA